MSTSLGARIRSMRDERGLTQGDLADRVGVASFVSISRWERGITQPSVEYLAALAREFGVTIEDLLGDGEHSPIVGPASVEGE